MTGRVEGRGERDYAAGSDLLPADHARGRAGLCEREDRARWSEQQVVLLEERRHRPVQGVPSLLGSRDLDARDRPGLVGEGDEARLHQVTLLFGHGVEHRRIPRGGQGVPRAHGVADARVSLDELDTERVRERPRR